MVRYKVEFFPNRDNITCSFIVNSQVLNPEVPFVPNKLVDSRGIVLYLFLLEVHGIIENVQFVGESIDEEREIKRLYNYLFNPVHVFKN
jgi:hypothetical protein